LPRPPRSTLSPYTTLFRSRLAPDPVAIIDDVPVGRVYRDGHLIVPAEGAVRERRKLAFSGMIAVALALGPRGEVLSEPEIALERSEEHTSELQSRENLVCR